MIIHLKDGNYIQCEKRGDKKFTYVISWKGNDYKVPCRVRKWLKWASGMSLYPKVYLNEDFWHWEKSSPIGTADLLQHEFFHWYEQKNEWLPIWLFKYLRDWVKVGFKYALIPDEKQANEFDENYE